MKYRIVKGFKGSQDGRTVDEFKAGTDADLSAELADVAVREGWAIPANEIVPDQSAASAEQPKRRKARA